VGEPPGFGEVLRFIAERWRGFRELLRAGEKGELPGWSCSEAAEGGCSSSCASTTTGWRGMVELGYYDLRLKFRGELCWWPGSRLVVLLGLQGRGGRGSSVPCP